MSAYYAAYLLRACPLALALMLSLARNPARGECLRDKIERGSEGYIPYEVAA